MKSKLLIASLFSAVALAACGGGGGGETASPPPPLPVAAPPSSPAPEAVTGGISARFAAGVPASLLFTGIGQQSGVELTSHTQETSGAITAANQMKLTGAQLVRDIAGDDTFAMGRWAAGSTEGVGVGGSSQLSESSNSTYHYLLLARATSYPASGTLTCSDAKFTAPGWAGNGSSTSAYLGTSGGSATLTFSPQGAGVTVTVNTQAGGAAASRTFNGTLSNPTQFTISGSIGANSANAYLTVGRAGTDAFAIGGIYTIDMPGGANYQGAFRFVCK